MSNIMPVIAGSISTLIFATSYLPMLVKAVRTRDLASYSKSNLLLTNLGNLVHSFYVFSLPAGPIWALHIFYLVSSTLMTVWYLHLARRRPPVSATTRTFASAGGAASAM